MQSLNVILTFVHELLKANGGPSSSIMEFTDKLVVSVQIKVFAMALKIFGAMTLTSLIIFSLLSIGKQIDFILLSVENGPFVAIAIDLIVATVCGIFLLRLMKPGSTGRSMQDSNPNQTNQLADLTHQLVVSFINGLIEGLEKSKAQTTQKMPNSEITSEPVSHRQDQKHLDQ